MTAPFAEVPEWEGDPDAGAASSPRAEPAPTGAGPGEEAQAGTAPGAAADPALPGPEPEPAPAPEQAPYETVEQDALAVPPASTPTRSDAVDPQLDALRDATFPVVWRGYDVQAVDDYVAAVEAALERFEERTTPTIAVQRALDRVGEQTAAILRQAEQAADETTRASRARADDRLQRAEREAAALHEAAVARVRALDDDVERLWQERQRLIDATKALAGQLRTVAEDAESRFPPAAPEAPEAPEGPEGSDAHEAPATPAPPSAEEDDRER
nr:DivIVA domain-containing protein [Conexibacter arvalis]